MSRPARGEESYASLRAGRQANGLLVEAVGLLQGRAGRALDLGAGPLSDSLLLLRAGFTVDAVDNDPHTQALAAELEDASRLEVILADIRDLRPAAGAYALIVAIHVLPFLPRGDLLRTVPAIVDGLAEDGLLCCTLLGPEDGWAGRRPRMTLLPRSEVGGLFGDLAPVVFSERTYDGTDARGEPKRWHDFRCILRKAGRRGAPVRLSAFSSRRAS